MTPDALEERLREVYGRIFPMRRPVHKHFNDDVLALGLYIERRLSALSARVDALSAREDQE